MVAFPKMFRDKRSLKIDGTRTALHQSDSLTECGNDNESNTSNSIAAASDDVSSLGNSIYSDTDTAKNKTYKPQNRHHQNHRPAKFSVDYASGIFPHICQGRTGNQEADDIDQVSVERRRKIFEEDLDSDLAWDTTMTIDERRYRSRNQNQNRSSHHPLSSWMACLACV